MRKKILLLLSMALVLSFQTYAQAVERLVQAVAEGCQKELDTYCKDVSPGQARGLACLYAHSDKLSGRCEYALYDAAVQLERAVAELSYVVNECKDDLNQFCSDVPVGQGRLISCLEQNESKISQRCKQSLEDTGLK